MQVNHLLKVINQAGYLDGVEKSVNASILSDRESVVIQKNSSSKALTQIDSDIKSLVRLQMQTDNVELQNLYSGQLIELQEQRKRERETLDRCELALADIIDPKKFVSGLQEGLKRLQMAWTKANPKMRKALLRVVVDRLIFKEGQAQVFYRQINQDSGDGKPKNKVVNLSDKRESMKLNDKNHPEASSEAKEESFYKSLELFKKSSHNPMAQGWDIGKNGCSRQTISHHQQVADKIRLSNFTKQAISEKAVDLYQSGASLRSIAKELGCSKTAIRESLIREKVDLRAHSHSQANKSRKSATLSVRNAPYGYCLVNGVLVEDPREMSVVALMLKWWDQGTSYGAIARKLNSQKIKPRKAATWSQPTVGFIVQRQSKSNRRSK